MSFSSVKVKLLAVIGHLHQDRVKRLGAAPCFMDGVMCWDGWRLSPHKERIEM